MPKHKIQWINDHTQICDRLDERVQLMQEYLKPNLTTSTDTLSNNSY